MRNDFDNEVRTAAGISVHSGFPNPATDKRLHGLDFNQLLIKSPSSTFLFRIRGEQGNSRGLYDGDIAVIDRLLRPRSTDLVLWHDGEQFKLSVAARVPAGSTLWGVMTAMIRQYRSTP